MSRVLSFRDLRLIPALAEYTEFELLSIERDQEVNDYLAQLGFDILQPVLYVPAKHRDLQGQVGIGYRAVGEITASRSYLQHPLCTPIERMLIEGMTDIGLTKELAKLMGVGLDIRGHAEEGDSDTFPLDQCEPDFERVAAEIAMLTVIRDEIRGSPYNESGALKTEEEYAQS